MITIKKQIYFIFFMICTLFVLNAEDKKIAEFKQIEYCTISFTSDIPTYYSEIRIQKNTKLQLDKFPRLSNSKYKLTGWKSNNKIIKKDIVVNNNMQFEAIWEEKTFLPADWIQIAVVIVALFGIIIPIWFQWRQNKKEKIQEELQKPKIRLHCDEKNEGIFTKCCFKNGNTIYNAISFKIRAYNDGLSTAKNIQIKILTFDITDGPKLADFDKTIKLNWSYQDQQKRLNLPLEKKMDIQAKTFEDCDFVFYNQNSGLGYFASEESNLILSSKGLYRVIVIVSGDNIISEEYFTSFSFDPDDKNNPIKVIVDFQKDDKNE